MLYSLDGQWLIAIDPENRGRDEEWWTAPREDASTTRVPWIIQHPFPGYHGVAWYWKTFTGPQNPFDDGRDLLRFHAVDYLADVWLNGTHVGSHEGGETPFTLDVTGVLKSGEENLLAVRVLNPTHEPVDNIVLKEIPHRNKDIPYSAGRSYNHGGVVGSIEILTAPSVRIDDIWLRPDVENGVIRVATTAISTKTTTARCRIHYAVSPAAGGEKTTDATGDLMLSPGSGVAHKKIRISNLRMWDLNDPYLYRVTVRLVCEGISDERTERCGFRDFRFDNGAFRLNGRRIYLKGSHTGNHTPVGQQVPHDPDLFRRDLLNVKMMGFNTIRFIAGMPTRYQLDLCDEIGLLVYEESYAAWELRESPHMEERYDRSTREMILRDRNHPSIVIWGMLNETDDGPVFRHAVDALELVRSLDPDRLVLLNSGRWDCAQDIGSLSNPGSDVWEHHIGGEAPDAEKGSSTWGGYFEKAGDAHAYPRVPHTAEVISFLRTVGHDTKPIIITEYGIGSAVDLWRLTRLYERMGEAEAEDALFYRQQLERFLVDWERWNMEEVFGHPAEYFSDAVRKMANQRRIGLDAIRSNPKIVGHSVTGTVDQGMTGEGVFTTFRELKRGTTDVMFECFAPVRLCLFAEPVNAWRGDSVMLEAVLVDENTLTPGEYPVRLQVLGPDRRCVWQRDITVTVADDAERPFATSVFCEDVPLDVPTGEYRFIANFQRGATATGGDVSFHVTDRADLPEASGDVLLCGGIRELSAWLTDSGVKVTPFTPEAVKPGVPVIVGSDIPEEERTETVSAVFSAVEAGATAVFLSADVFAQGEESLALLPVEGGKELKRIAGWLYLKDEWARRHPVFDGLPAGGLLDYDVYREVIPDYVYNLEATPTEAVAGANKTSQNYDAGLLVSVHEHGQGRFILNTLQLIENLGTSPVAERILRNLVTFAQQ